MNDQYNNAMYILNYKKIIIKLRSKLHTSLYFIVIMQIDKLNDIQFYDRERINTLI